MPLFHFTFHSYRSWNADHRKGYIQRGELGIKEPHEPLAAARDELARDDPVFFLDGDQQYLILALQEAVARRGWELYGATVITTHVHFIAGWRDFCVVANDVQVQVKRALGFLLAKRHGTKGKPYFSRGGIPKEVKDRKHLLWLVNSYFPKHGGPCWKREGL